MATISTIPGVQDSSLLGQVSEKARPAKEHGARAPVAVPPDSPRPEHPEENTKLTNSNVKKRVSATLEEAQQVAAELQKRMDEMADDPHQVSIRTDENTQNSVIQIKDPDGEVVKQYPPEKVLNLYEKLDDLSGMVIDEVI